MCVCVGCQVALTELGWRFSCRQYVVYIVEVMDDYNFGLLSTNHYVMMGVEPGNKDAISFQGLTDSQVVSSTCII